ncbi:MAG: hypothetical protein LBL04_04835 [Bacteroidales bacterium]|jgi:hypothetical protein|nr:hypothetical protein [Bacteroidales bacterium]
MKAVVLLSKTFFKGHPKAGQPTYFKQKVLAAQMVIKRPTLHVTLTAPDGSEVKERKIHTCRANYEYWKKKIDRLKVEGGVLSIRQWSEKPYRSPHEIIVDIPAETIGVQKLGFGREPDCERIHCTFVDGKIANFIQIAHNDGLSAADFEAWFENYDLTQPMAIIHFTNFRY